MSAREYYSKHLDAPQDHTLNYLRENCPIAVMSYRLLSENRACVAIARSHATTMENPEHGRLLIAANVEARRMSAIEYLGVLGYAVDRAKLALSAHDVPSDVRRELHERVVALEGFAGDVMAVLEEDSK